MKRDDGVEESAGAVLPAPAAGMRPQQRVLSLPRPRMGGGTPLLTALRQRRSIRAFEPRALPIDTLAELLWAACGVNRPGGDRTVPAWQHTWTVDVCVAMASGCWKYEPHTHTLRQQCAADLRGRTGRQDFVGTAPIELVYVAHGERMPGIPPQERRLNAFVETACIAQNVYLFCASEGLATVLRGALDAAELGHALRLAEGQFVTLAQTVGYPA